MTVERALRLPFQASLEWLALFWNEKAFAVLAMSKKEGAAGDKEIAEGVELQDAIVSALGRLDPEDGLPQRPGVPGQSHSGFS